MYFRGTRINDMHLINTVSYFILVVGLNRYTCADESIALCSYVGTTEKVGVMGRVSNQTEIDLLCIIMWHPFCGSIFKIDIMSSFISSNLPAQ